MKGERLLRDCEAPVAGDEVETEHESDLIGSPSKLSVPPPPVIGEAG